MRCNSQTSSTVGQNVSVTTVRSQQLVGFAGDLFFGTIGGNVSRRRGVVVAGRHEIRRLVLGRPSRPRSAATLNINLGNGNNELQNIGPFTVIDGNTNIQMGDGNSSISLGGTAFGGTQGGIYQGNLNVQLGNGNNTDGTTDPNLLPAGLRSCPRALRSTATSRSRPATATTT